MFAPFYYRSLLYIASSAEGGLIEHILGDEFKWSGNISSDNLVLINGDDEIVPEVRNSSLGLELTYSALNWEPGFVSIQNDEEKYQVAVNIDISESEFVNIDDRLLSQSALRVRTINTAEIPDQALTNEIIASGFGREIWQWFMWAGLFFLVLESLISTFYKTETSN